MIKFGPAVINWNRARKKSVLTSTSGTFTPRCKVTWFTKVSYFGATTLAAGPPSTPNSIILKTELKYQHKPSRKLPGNSLAKSPRKIQGCKSIFAYILHGDQSAKHESSHYFTNFTKLERTSHLSSGITVYNIKYIIPI